MDIRRGAELTTSGAPADIDGLVPVPGAYFAEIPVDRISPNPRQPRQVFDEDEMAELVHSVREIGVLQPVVVRPVPADSPDAAPDGEGQRYELIMGERRWRASQQAGLSAVPAIVRETAEDDLLRDALLENLHRSQLNPLEEAAAYQQLLDDFGCTHDELASRIGRSRPQISNTLRLLRLPPLVQRRVAAGVLSAGHARALLGLDDAPAMERLAQRIVAEGLSVRSVEEIVAVGEEPGPVTAQAEGRGSDGRSRRPGRPALRPLRDPGQDRPGPEQGPAHRGVRDRGGPPADRPADGPGRGRPLPHDSLAERQLLLLGNRQDVQKRCSATSFVIAFCARRSRRPGRSAPRRSVRA